MDKKEEETPLSSLRNKLTPFLNLAAMVNIEDKRLDDLVKEEAIQCKKNMPKIYDLLDELEKFDKASLIERIEKEIRKIEAKKKRSDFSVLWQNKINGLRMALVIIKQ